MLSPSSGGASVLPAGDSAVTISLSGAAGVEDKLRHVTQIKRIRVSEFFKDFDPLRSGYITSKSNDCIVLCLVAQLI